MCKVGDIIVVTNYKSGYANVSTHSFVVLNTKDDKIEGLDYNIVCNVMSSFRSEAQKKKKLSYPGNFEVTATDSEITKGHPSKDGYIKAERFY